MPQCFHVESERQIDKELVLPCVYQHALPHLSGHILALNQYCEVCICLGFMVTVKHCDVKVRVRVHISYVMGGLNLGSACKVPLETLEEQEDERVKCVVEEIRSPSCWPS